MTKIGKSPPRSLRIAARAAVATALMAGTTAAVATSAHAASPRMPQGSDITSGNCASGSLTPLKIINATSGQDAFTSGTLTVMADGATVTFTANGTTTPAANQTGSFNGVAGACVASDANSDATTPSPNGSSDLSNSTLGTCQFSSYDFRVNADGTDTLNVLLRCVKGSSTTMQTITTGSVLGSSGAATPELGSGELLATGLLPLGIFLYRRRRQQAAK